MFLTLQHHLNKQWGGGEESDSGPSGRLITLGRQARLINCPDLLKTQAFHWAWGFQFSNWDTLVTLLLTKEHAE